MNLPAIFCYFLSVFGPCLVLNVLQCERFSAQEYYYSNIIPEVRSTLLEMRMYFNTMFDKLESNIFAIAPELEHDDDKRMNYSYNLYTIKDFVDQRVTQAGFEVDSAWGKLFGVSSNFLEDPQTSITEDDLLLLLESVERAHENANALLEVGTREFVLFYEAMVSEGLESITRLIEDEIPEAPTDDFQIAKLIKEKIRQVVPGNFLGMLIGRILDRGTGSNNHRPSDPIYLKPINARISEVRANFTSFVTQREIFTSSDWHEFWQSTVRIAMETKEDRVIHTAENLGKMYKNEVYLAEILMNLMTHY